MQNELAQIDTHTLKAMAIDLRNDAKILYPHNKAEAAKLFWLMLRILTEIDRRTVTVYVN